MPEYLAPGVYVEELDTAPTPIPGVSTSTIDLETAHLLVAAMRPIIERVQPDWTHFNDSDPGVTVIQLLAWVAERVLDRSGSEFEQRRRAVLRAATVLTTAAGACSVEYETLKRPSYFAGRLLDAATLQLEQDYHREKLRRHNRNLHGVGIVSGLEVQVDAATDTNGGGIRIEPGYAVDGCGEEIAVTARIKLALPRDGEAAFVSLRHWNHPCAQMLSHAGTIEVSCMEEACLVAIAGNVLPPGLALARLVRLSGHWEVDGAFVPTRSGIT